MKRRIEITRKSGCLVIKYGMKTVRVYDRDEVIATMIPRMPRENETVKIEIRESNNA